MLKSISFFFLEKEEEFILNGGRGFEMPLLGHIGCLRMVSKREREKLGASSYSGSSSLFQEISLGVFIVCLFITCDFRTLIKTM